MPNLKKKVEALLFSSGKRMNIEEIAKLCHSKPEDAKQSLAELKKEYDEKDSSLMFIEEGNFWKLTVREQYLPIVQKIVTETELSKTIMETLAVIAFKYPIRQSDLIKIRTNKAYDHLSELEEAGYISRQKQGRTKLIKLTDKFFEYFDLPRDKLKEQFKDFDSIARAIEQKEHEIEKIREEQKEKAEEAKKEDERLKQAAESVDENEAPLETYESEKEEVGKNDENIIIAKEKLGEMEVVDEPPKAEPQKGKEAAIQKIQEEDKKLIEEKKIKEEKAAGQKKKSIGIKLTKEMEKEVDRKVEEMLHPPKEEEYEESMNIVKEKSQKETSEQSRNSNETDEAPKDLLEAARDEEENKNKTKKQFR